MGTAGYSATPQLRKLGISPGIALVVINKPRGWNFAEPLPAVARTADSADVLLAFVKEPSDLDALEAWSERIFPTGAIWVAWPRKAAGHHSDVSENLIRERALPMGIVDVKVAAIDGNWSGLKLVWRKELRR